ncbi:MAG: BlaI/MecI/CopY family transcriptional regulator [Lachnospiraceae bacterium]|jgi:BlaI family penicillinase repressor|nr:BlaI/MecI/CopY family transcriptional regulator [Lachnospiraceae bacterium]MCI9018358.1 BlaI/MecI/CopY family transcriptional regulator [Lachnospiraceae bacterium]MCI9681989.1 BlaI/MecI/CopY family transcriptional regulator [Lachnospiraceae bacterium]
MEPYKLGEMEQKFADLIWKHAPITTGELVKLCEQTFEWKRTTTYTMLKRLCLRNLFENVGGTVEIKTTREDFQAAQGEQFLMENFDGSLPRFLTAFSRRKKLSSREVAELRRLIEAYEEDTEGGNP